MLQWDFAQDIALLPGDKPFYRDCIGCGYVPVPKQGAGCDQIVIFP